MMRGGETKAGVDVTHWNRGSTGLMQNARKWGKLAVSRETEEVVTGLDGALKAFGRICIVCCLLW